MGLFISRLSTVSRRAEECYTYSYHVTGTAAGSDYLYFLKI
jgi:hypothetical protein